MGAAAARCALCYENSPWSSIMPPAALTAFRQREVWLPSRGRVVRSEMTVWVAVHLLCTPVRVRNGWYKYKRSL